MAKVTCHCSQKNTKQGKIFLFYHAGVKVKYKYITAAYGSPKPDIVCIDVYTHNIWLRRANESDELLVADLKR